MLEFELEVMLIGIRAEPDLLDDYLGRIGLHLLRLLFLLIDILLVVYDLADRGIHLGGDLHQIQLEALCQPLGFPQWIDTGLRDVVSHEPYLRRCDLVIDPGAIVLPAVRLAVALSIAVAALVVLLGSGGPGSTRKGALFDWCCDKVVLLNF